MAACGNDYGCDIVRKLGLHGFWGSTAQFLLDKPLKILFVVVVAAVLSRVLGRLARKAVESLAGTTPVRRVSPRADQRARTLASVTGSVVRIIVWTIAGLTILGLVGLNLGPLIAGASIVGVALGFGAQALVRDFLSGFFILVEDQYGVGDIVNLGDTGGTVEEVNLRVTRVRSFDGTVWYMPNGEIKKVGNTSKEWARAVVDVVVGLSTDITAAVTAINDELAGLADDPMIADGLLDSPAVLGVDSVGADSLTIRVAARVHPERRVAVERAMRARVADRLRRDGHSHAPEQLVVP
jgi:small conductance mechanosensitive channel